MKRWIVLILVMACTALVGCRQSEPEDLQQGDNGIQYFFSGEVTETDDEFLRIEVNDIGNSNLSEGDTVEVSTDVVAADGCPEFTVGEYARVLLTRNIEDSVARLEALSIYKIDETGAILPIEASDENEVVEFHGQSFNKSTLSEETLEWLDWYHSLSPEEQLAVSSIPADLYTDDGMGTVDSDTEE